MLPRLAAVFFAFGGLVVAERSPLFEELRYRDVSFLFFLFSLSDCWFWL